jgi:hypothetical protein
VISCPNHYVGQPHPCAPFNVLPSQTSVNHTTSQRTLVELEYPSSALLHLPTIKERGEETRGASLLPDSLTMPRSHIVRSLNQKGISPLRVCSSASLLDESSSSAPASRGRPRPPPRPRPLPRPRAIAAENKHYSWPLTTQKGAEGFKPLVYFECFPSPPVCKLTNT